MTWLRRVLAHFATTRRLPIDPQLEETRHAHHATLRRADRVIEEYRKLDGVLKVYVARRR